MDANTIAHLAKQAATDQEAKTPGQEYLEYKQARKNVLKEERIQQLIKGEVEAPNDYAKFIVGQIRDILAKGQTLGQQMERAKAFLAQAEKEALELAGAAEQYIVDLKRWDRPLDSGGAEVVSSKNGETKSAEGEVNA